MQAAAPPQPETNVGLVVRAARLMPRHAPLVHKRENTRILWLSWDYYWH